DGASGLIPPRFAYRWNRIARAIGLLSPPDDDSEGNTMTAYAGFRCIHRGGLHHVPNSCTVRYGSHRRAELIPPRTDHCRDGTKGESHIAKQRARDRERRDSAVSRKHSPGSTRRPASTPQGHALAHPGARQGSVAGRAARDAAGAPPLLVDRVRLAQMRGPTEWVAAVH